MASAHDSQGWSHELWVLDNDPSGHLTVLTGPDGQQGPIGLGCSPGLHEPVEFPPDRAYAGGFFPDDPSRSIALAGRLPSSVASAVVIFNDGTSTSVEPSTDGYFAAMIEDHSGRARAVASIDLLDDNGTLIERQDINQP